MIRRIVILAFVFCLFVASAEAQAIKRVQKSGSSDSTKVDKKAGDLKEAERKAAIQKKQQQQQQKQKQIQQRQDQFIDRDGDGINDKIIQSQQPAKKKQSQPKVTTPKVPETKAVKPAQKKKADTSNTSKSSEDESKKSKR